MPRWPLLAVAVAAACAVPLAAAAKKAAPPVGARPVVVGAAPTPDPSDRPGGRFLRVTFSPDGDGRNDVVSVRVHARHGDRLVLQMRPAGGITYAEVGGDRSGAQTSTLTWDGIADDGHRWADGSYVLEVCDATTRLCAATEVLAHLRILTMYTPRAVGVSAGDTIPVDVATDRTGPYTLDLVSAANPNGPGLGAMQVAGPGRLRYRVPDVPDGGLWVLRLRSAQFVTHFPLVVHEPTLPLADPPPHTALVVYPYITWRAYDRYDENRDGRIDSWYAHPQDPVVPLYGPFEMDRRELSLLGREPNPSGEGAFAAWMLEHGLKAQAVTDVELGRMPLSLLRRYATVVFEGHTEYYELGTYEKLLRYRNGGGRLYFFQGNSFYGQARVGRSQIVRLSYRYRTRQRSDFRLAADGFRSCCWPRSIRPVYRVAPGAVAKLPWLFAGTGLKAGDAFGIAAGEVDAIDPRLSPAGTVRVASARVPRFVPVGYLRSTGYIGTRPFHYEPSSRRPRQIDVAYAATGKGEVFAWGTEVLETLRYGALPEAERAALDRAALNVWRRFTR